MSGGFLSGVASRVFPAPVFEDLADAIEHKPAAPCECGAPAVYEFSGEVHCEACVSIGRDVPRFDLGAGISVREYYRDQNGVLCARPPWFLFGTRYRSERDIRQQYQSGVPVPGGTARIAGHAMSAWETVASVVTVLAPTVGEVA